MSGWSVPLSSSPPSTPGSKGFRPTYVSDYDGTNESFASNPSTTPAGPPPSARSFTPVDPPPSSIFDSSQLGSGKTLFKSKSPLSSTMSSRRVASSPSFKTGRNNVSNGNLFKARSPAGVRQAARRTQGFHVPSSSPPSRLIEDDEEDYLTEEEEEIGEYSDDPQEGSMEVDSDAENQPYGGESTTRSQTNGSLANGSGIDWAQLGSSLSEGTPRGIKRSRGGAAISHGVSRHNTKDSVRKKESAIPSIAKNIATQMGVAGLDDPDSLILRTEDLVSQLYTPEDVTGGPEIVLEIALPTITEELDEIWQSYRDQSRRKSLEDVLIGIGPNENAPALHKATFLSSLLLQLHHPPAAKGKQAFAASRANQNSSLSESLYGSRIPQRPTALPKILLDWLEINHNPYRKAMVDLQTYQPSPTANLNFWDVIFSLALRGKISEIIRVLQRSDFQYARTAREDGQNRDGYHGTQLGNIKRVINRAIQVLELCPSVQDGNWEITRNDWLVFRKRVEQAMTDLATFAEGRDRDLEPTKATFEAPNFGIRNSTTNLSQSARRAESQVPWTIYQNLKALYGMMLGGTSELIASAQDWVEATIGLTAWWDGGDEDDEVVVGSLAMTRRSLRQSQSRGGRLVDLNSTAAYLRRLALSFERATDELDDDMFQINSANPVEVGLASVFEGNVEGVISLLRGWSLPVASAVAEIASLGGWFESCLGGGMQNGLDENDLLVLSSYEHREQGLSRDGILVEYADQLFEKDDIQAPRPKDSREGWELSIQILARLEDRSTADKKLIDLLSQLPLVSDLRVDKILDICQDFNMAREARNIAERYADSIAESSDRYGTALIYYARAHRQKKVKDVLDLLISLSLVQSIAFPPLSSIDHNLHALVFNPSQSLEEIAALDPHAAEMLHTYLTGYATLRRFYDLRDEEANLNEGEKPKLRPIARKKAAAACLLAVINSAADNIHGGLYDDSRNSIVQVDGLLALFGETLVFVDQSPSSLTRQQLFALLKAIEDLQTVTPRIYQECESCFQSTMGSYHGHVLPEQPRELVKKSFSGLTGSSGFSLVGSEMTSEGAFSIGRNGARKVQERKRAWDWRKGLGRDAKGEDVLRILRMGLARDVARIWGEGGGL